MTTAELLDAATAAPPTVSGVRITDLTVTIFEWENIPAIQYGDRNPITKPRSELGLVTLHTDAGIEGHAFLGSSIRGARLDVVALMRNLKPVVVGQDPFDRERLWENLHKLQRAATMRTIGAVDVALWDLAGKITGLPVDVAARTIRRNCCCRRRLQCNGAVEIGQGRLDLAIAAVGLGTNQQSIDLKAGSWRGLDDGVASRDQYRRCLAAIGIAGSAKGRTRRSDDGAASESRGDEKQVRFPAQHSRRHRMHRPTADRRFNLFAFRHRFTSDLQGQ